MYEVDFAIVTALPVEREAVKNRLSTRRKLKGRQDGRIYYRGRIELSHGEFYEIVTVCLTEPGNEESATGTLDMINAWNPKHLLLIGIAGGISQKDLELGDVVVADQVFRYDFSKETVKGSELRLKVYRCSSSLLKLVKDFLNDEWIGKINSARPKKGRGMSKIHVEPIASGNKVIANKKYHKMILASHSKIHAVEMEAGGFMHVIDSRTDPPKSLVIRGVSDMAGEDKGDIWHEYASNAAAAFTIEFLKSRPVDPLYSPEIILEPNKFDQLINLSLDVYKNISWKIARQIAYAYKNKKGKVSHQEIIKILGVLGLLKKEKMKGRLRLTNAGLLLICKRPYIQIPQSKVSADVYSSLDMSTSINSKDFFGPIPQILEQAFNFIQSNMDEKTILIGEKRRKVPKYPIPPLREALINAVAHRDYNIRWGNIHILMFPDRIVISSPGRLVNQLKLSYITSLKYRPISRNALLVQALNILGYMEERGSGIKRMYKYCTKHGLKSPVFKHKGEYFEVLFYG